MYWLVHTICKCLCESVIGNSDCGTPGVPLTHHLDLFYYNHFHGLVYDSFLLPIKKKWIPHILKGFKVIYKNTKKKKKNNPQKQNKKQNPR